jgi:hypothetical protein
MNTCRGNGGRIGAFSDPSRGLGLSTRDANDVALVRSHLTANLRIRPHVHAVVFMLDDLCIDACRHQTVECMLSLGHGARLRARQHNGAAKWIPHRGTVLCPTRDRKGRIDIKRHQVWEKPFEGG